MGIKEDIEQLVEESRLNLAQLNPISFSAQAKTLLRSAFQSECDPEGDFEDCHGAYGTAAKFLFEQGFASAAIHFLIEWWNDFAQLQADTGRRVYRAATAYMLAHWYVKLGDKGAALRWALLTHADDVLGNDAQVEGAGRQWLQTIMGVSEAELDKFSSVAAVGLDKVNNFHGGNWTVAAGYAEDALVRIAQAHPELAHLFAEETTAREYPLTPAYFQLLLRQVEATDGSTTERGDRLEHLAIYLFLLIPGWVPTAKVKPDDQSSEHDIVVSNLSRMSNLSAELFGRHFLVECKNWAKPVRVDQVGYFLYRMRLTHCKFGVIFAKSGITGNQDEEKAARALLRRAFHEDGSVCVVLDLDDLKALSESKDTFWSLLLQRSQSLQFGGPTLHGS